MFVLFPSGKLYYKRGKATEFCNEHTILPVPRYVSGYFLDQH